MVINEPAYGDETIPIVLVFTADIMFGKTLLFLFGLAVVSSRRAPFYRKDYTYFDQFDAFYKLHWDKNGMSWNSAFLACDDEGSTLFYPKTKDEWTVVKSLVSASKVKPNVSEVLVGIHDEFGLGEFMTVDGLTTPSPLFGNDQPDLTGQRSCVTMDIETGTYKVDSCMTEQKSCLTLNQEESANIDEITGPYIITDNCENENLKPFVCKAVDESCPTVDSGYIYVKKNRKCYKVSQTRKTWADAMHTCFMEGGVLAVIKNSEEAEFIRNILSNHHDRYYFMGFRKLYDDDFYTIRGQKLDDNFYNSWYGYTYYTKENGENIHEGNCGTLISENMKLFNINCLERAPFLCEMTAQI